MSVYPKLLYGNVCPDWKNNSIFISHMGEINVNLAACKPEYRKWTINIPMQATLL